MFKRGNLDTIHQQTALVLILKGGIGKSMHTFLLKQNENVIEGNEYLLYGWFSSMRVARVIQAMPSNCTFI